MVKLQIFCLIVAEGEGSFLVLVDESDLVEHLKEAIKLKNKDITVPLRKLQLFLTNENGGWLSATAPDVIAIRNGKIPAGLENLMKVEMAPAALIGDVFKGAPTKDTIHVLVKVIEPLVPNKRQKTMWKKTITLDPADTTLPFEKGEIWKLDPNAVAGFGLEFDSKLCLYCRDDSEKLITFLRDDVLCDGSTGIILGPPGTGKSTTAAVFALSLARTTTWVITWIHLGLELSSVCVRLEGNEMKTARLLQGDVDSLQQMLDEVDDTKHHIVFLDGLRHDKRQEEIICKEWMTAKPELRISRRLVMVTSMAFRRKADMGEDKILQTKMHVVPSWVLDDYLEAVKDDDLFGAVQHNLDASSENKPSDVSSLQAWRKSLVESKYYFAGGSARYMFGYSTEDVMIALDEAVECADDTTGAATGTPGERAANVINRLYGRFRDKKRGLISLYAASKLAIVGGAELIKRFSKALRKDSNPAMDGWILEIFFFASIRDGGLVVKEGDKEIKFPKSEIVVVDPNNLPPLPNQCWLKPRLPNQGGYDTVYIDKVKRLVHFVQVTKSDKHSFLIDYFYVMIRSLVEREMLEITEMEIFFVIESQSLAAFKFSRVTGQGLLEAFKWEKGKETKKVRLVAVDGVDSWDALRWFHGGVPAVEPI